MKRGLSFAIFALCGVFAFLSYTNAQPSPQIKGLSRQTACGGAEGCVVKNDDPNVAMTSIFNHRYQWLTSNGNVVVTCKREYVFFGEWSCASAPGELAH